MLTSLLAKIRGSELSEQTEEPAEETTLAMAAAALFFEVAWADHTITDHELELVRAGIMSQFGLTAAVVDEGGEVGVVQRGLPHVPAAGSLLLADLPELTVVE